MSIDKTKPARGFVVNQWTKGWQANADTQQMADDCGTAGDHDSSSDLWPEGERYYSTEAEAIAASHRYREEFVRPDVVAFAERVAASLRARAQELWTSSIAERIASTKLNGFAETVLAAAKDSAMKLPWEADE